MVRKLIKKRTTGRIRGVGGTRKRRKKGELTKIKEALWLLCRQITKARYGNSCYTCGRVVPDGKGMHTGHFITSSLCSTEMRFDVSNLRPQCYHCNINLSGNWPSYLSKMKQEIGGDEIDAMLARNLGTKGRTYPIQWFLDKQKEYTQLLQSISTG